MNYLKLNVLAKKLIEKNGKTFTLRKKVEGTYDPANNSISIATTDSTFYGVLKNYYHSYFDNQTIKRGDKLLIASSTVEIEVQDVILEGSTKWNVINVEEIKPADTNLLYKVQVR